MGPTFGTESEKYNLYMADLGRQRQKSVQIDFWSALMSMEGCSIMMKVTLKSFYDRNKNKPPE